MTDANNIGALEGQWSEIAHKESPNWDENASLLSNDERD